MTTFFVNSINSWFGFEMKSFAFFDEVNKSDDFSPQDKKLLWLQCGVIPNPKSEL